MDWRGMLRRARQEPLDPAVVARVVAAVVPGARVAAIEPMGGGLSSLLDLVLLAPDESRQPPHDRLVLRRLLPEFGHDGAAVGRELAAHRVAAAAGVPAPEPLWASEDDAVLGRPALLLPFVPGRAIVAELADPTAMDRFVATVHAIGAVECSEPAADSLPVDDGTAGGGPTLPAHLRSDLVDAARLHRVVRGLATTPVAARRLVHGDLHGGNVLWDGQRVTGVLDWSDGARGDPRADEEYAVLDTLLAHGTAVGERLRARIARPSADTRGRGDTARWWGEALLRALPSPAAWVDGYTAAGCAVAEDDVVARWVDEVEGFLRDHG